MFDFKFMKISDFKKDGEASATLLQWILHISYQMINNNDLEKHFFLKESYKFMCKRELYNL